MKIRQILSNFRQQFALTLLLVLLDAGLLVLFPLFIGLAIDDGLQQVYTGSILLGGLGLVSLLVGAGRRWFDSRFYAKVYEDYGTIVGSRLKGDTSSKTAHLRLLGEVVEFFENSVPAIINSSVGLLGTLTIVAFLDLRVFLGCALVLLMVVMVYGFTERKTVRLNKGYNDELERQVDCVGAGGELSLRNHLRKLMRWNIRLSDLETINFSVVWLVMMAFLVLSIFTLVSDGLLQYGAIFSLILYLFQFIESVSALPFFYQQWLRLIEITGRLGKV